MKTEVTTITLSCDHCGKENLDIHHPSFGEGREKHFCTECCRKLEEYVQRVLYKSVRDRRGGWRQLGVYDG